MGDNAYQAIKAGLDASAMRQRTISSNIANVNTPGYKAYKVEFESKLKEALGENGITMKKTNEKHLGGGNIGSISPEVVKTTGSMNENGNNVDIDGEMVDLAANEIYYSALVSQLNSKLGIMNYVINK